MILYANNKKLQKKKKSPREERENYNVARWRDYSTNDIVFCFDANNCYSLFFLCWFCFYF